MPAELFFNELSARFYPLSDDEGFARGTRFAQTLLSATSAGAARVLRSHEMLSVIRLAEGFTFFQWLQKTYQSKDRDLARFFSSLAAKFPLLVGLPEAERDGVTDGFRDVWRAHGLKAAFLARGLSVSLDGDDHWERDFLSLRFSELVDDEEVQQEVEVRNVASSRAVEAHHEWIQKRKVEAIQTGDDLYRLREVCFPNLAFCPGLEDECATLKSESLGKYLRGLEALNDAARRWTHGPFNQSILVWAFSQESPSTLQTFKKEHTFRCPDGAERLFSLHVKVGKPERIYFDPSDGPGKKILIGHFGHLPTVRYN